MKLHFILNGKEISLECAPDRRAVDLLREDCQLTGTKESCGTGECGACTILVDQEIRLSCLMLATQLQGKSVLTVEGLAQGEKLHPLQQAFMEKGAVQCGYCTPGMQLAAYELLQKNQTPSRDEIRVALSGHICRCTGYVKIIDAVQEAAKHCRQERQS